MNDIRQSKSYADFMDFLGWEVEECKTPKSKRKTFVYIKKIPVIGSFIKILRANHPIAFELIGKLAKKHRAFKVFIQPQKAIPQNIYEKYGYKKAKESLCPTKTIFIDLTPNEQAILNKFSLEKRRAVRRAIKNNVKIIKAEDIDTFIGLKNQQLWPFGFLLNREIQKIWEVFGQKKKAVLLFAYKFPEQKPLAGLLLLIHERISYYWLASSTKEGKKLFAPSLLVWEALRYSKKLCCRRFDFEGIEDERFKNTANWSGFTRFKKGFGGRQVIFPPPIQKLSWPIL